MEGTDQSSGSMLEFFYPQNPGQSCQIQRGNRVGRRLSAIMIILHSKQDVARSFFGIKISALWVRKERVHLDLKFAGQPQPANIEICFVKVEQPLNQECVIFRKSVYNTCAAAKAAQQSLRIQILQQKIGGTSGGFKISRL